jgi:hypothetical protein
MRFSSADSTAILIANRKQVLCEVGLRKAEVHGEGQKELEFKMSYGDKGLNDNAV